MEMGDDGRGYIVVGRNPTKPIRETEPGYRDSFGNFHSIPIPIPFPSPPIRDDNLPLPLPPVDSAHGPWPKSDEEPWGLGPFRLRRYGYVKRGVTGLECCKTRGFTKPKELSLSLSLPQSDIGERLSKLLAFG